RGARRARFRHRLRGRRHRLTCRLSGGRRRSPRLADRQGPRCRRGTRIHGPRRRAAEGRARRLASLRSRRRVTRWLLLRGLGNRPLGRRVDAASIRAQSSSKRPSVEAGDPAILYASVWQAIFGVAEITGEPEHDPARDRWAWRFAIRPLVVVTDLERARGTIEHYLGRAVEKERMTGGERDAALGRLTLTTELADLAECDLVVEAVLEELPLKREVFAELDRITRPDAILATNTSALS